ncbi:MAG TPA: hypothetical protein VFG05_03185 [Methylocella sp.]|nr:hypothetical protein [Methylocella sp.]
MSKLYTEKHPALQDNFDVRRIADKLEPVIVHSEFAEHETGFIQSVDRFFLSTVNTEGGRQFPVRSALLVFSE